MFTTSMALWANPLAWNPQDKTPAIGADFELGLSNLNRTATFPIPNGVNGGAVRGVNPKSIGKLYFETRTTFPGVSPSVVPLTPVVAVGLVTQAGDAATFLGNQGTNPGLLLNNYGTTNSNGVFDPTYYTAGWVTGTVVSFAYDGSHIWVAFNNTWLNSPATSLPGDPVNGTNPFFAISGPLVPGYQIVIPANTASGVAEVSLYNTGSKLIYAPPYGFHPWSGA